jgi:hypothetical protein
MPEHDDRRLQVYDQETNAWLFVCRAFLDFEGQPVLEVTEDRDDALPHTNFNLCCANFPDEKFREEYIPGRLQKQIQEYMQNRSGQVRREEAPQTVQHTLF